MSKYFISKSVSLIVGGLIRSQRVEVFEWGGLSKYGRKRTHVESQDSTLSRFNTASVWVTHKRVEKFKSYGCIIVKPQ